MARSLSTVSGYAVAGVLSLALLLGGCAATKTAKERAAQAAERNAALQKTVTRLHAELEEKNIMTARLQMELVKKELEIAQLKSSREGLAQEFAGSAVHAPVASTKVETVAYLAEVATEIEAARETQRPDDQEVFAQADSLMEESSRALDNDRYEQSALLAAQAMELVARQRLDDVPEPKNTAGPGPYSEFLTPLTLKMAKRGKVRAAPGIRGKLVTTVGSGTAVTALGHKGSWIKVRLADGRGGWIYYSLLSIPKELEGRKKAAGKGRGK